MAAFGSDLVAHVLLLETESGLVLVDSGYGLLDIADPAGRLGPNRRLVGPKLIESEAAVRQVAALGFEPGDVRHIVITHFDFDHIGGLADFPEAQVHVTVEEVEGAMRAPSRRERQRYRAAQWAHGPKLVEHARTGEAWRGFAAAQELTEIAPGLVLVPLPGHTRGHAAVAVDAGDRWLLHAGDAFYHHGEIDGSRVPRVLSFAQVAIGWDRQQVRDNHARLAELHGRGEADLEIINAHDRLLFEQARERSLN